MELKNVADKILYLLVSGASGDSILASAAVLGVEPQEIPALLEQARRRLTLAADYNRVEEIGTARTRLNDIYKKALARVIKNQPAPDLKSALSAQRELNKLLNLFPQTTDPGQQNRDDKPAGRQPTPEEGQVFAAIDEYLEPLNLTDDPAAGYDELIRLAADEVKNARDKLENLWQLKIEKQLAKKRSAKNGKDADKKETAD